MPRPCRGQGSASRDGHYSISNGDEGAVFWAGLSPLQQRREQQKIEKGVKKSLGTQVVNHNTDGLSVNCDH